MKNIKNPVQLQLKDNFYIVRQRPMDDNESFPKSQVKHTFVEVEEVGRVEFDENRENLVLVKGRSSDRPYATVPEYNNVNFKEGDLITDKTIAFALALELAAKEKKKAEEILEKARQVVDGVNQNISILESEQTGNTVVGVFVRSKQRKSSSGIGTLLADKVDEANNEEQLHEKNEVDD